MSIYLRLLTYARPYVVFMVLSVVCMLIQSATTAGIAYLVKPAIDDVFVKNSPEISVRDIADWRKVLQLTKSDGPDLGGELLRSSMKKEDLKKIRTAKGVGYLSPRMKMSVVSAFNAVKDDLDVYCTHAGRVSVEKGSDVAQKLAPVVSEKIFRQDASGAWTIKKDLSGPDRDKVLWLNIALLRQMYPGIITKSSQKDFSMLYVIPVLFIIAYLVKGMADFGQAYFMGYVGNRAVTDIRFYVYRHMQTLSLAFFTKTSTGVLMSRVANDVGILRRSVSDSVKKVVQSFFLIIGLTAVAFYQNWKMAAICFLLLPLVAFIIVKLGRKSKRYSRRTQERMGMLSTFLDETISGNQTVKAFCMEDYEKGRFVQETGRLLYFNLKNLKVSVLASPVMGFLGGLMGAVIIYYGGYQVIQGTMTTGEFSSFIAAIAMLYRPIKAFSKENIKIQRGMAAAVRVFELLDIKPDVTEKENAVDLPPLRDEVAFRDVSFQYEDTPVLKNIDFTARAGEVVAIVGHSGAGKTTIANLLLRFYDVNGGGIYIDGVDLRDVTVKSLRDQIAFVSQETILFNDTVRNNIAYGSQSVSEEEIIKAAKAAYAHDFIQDMPAGYDTVVGEKGVRISGGQRQRISIARALVKDAPILILDEATSALDTHSEKEVQRALENLMQGRTTFIIAHRLATVRNADQIMVLSDGEIVERGSHDDLMKHSGVYNRLIEIQSQYKKKTTNLNDIC